MRCQAGAADPHRRVGEGRKNIAKLAKRAKNWPCGTCAEMTQCPILLSGAARNPRETGCNPREIERFKLRAGGGCAA
jgi:hypothetical protein